MIVKFFKYGTGNAKAAFNYLLNERVEDGTSKVLRGSPNLTLSIIKSMKQKHKYKSGCLSFEELNVTNDSKQEIMDLFEEVIFPGIAKSNRNITWVKHTDKGRLELNFVIPRVELLNYKAFNPYFHPKDKKRLSLFRDFINSKFNLSNPMEKGKEQRLKLTDLVKYSKNETIKYIDEYIYSTIQKGFITNKNQIVTELKALGFEIPRVGKDYISVKINTQEQKSKTIRLKGKFYKDFWSEEINENELPNNNSKDIYSKLEKEIIKAKEFNQMQLYSKNKNVKKQTTKKIDIKGGKNDSKKPKRVLFID